MFEWGGNKRATVIIQPNERAGSGVNIGMDGGSSGARPTTQQNQSLSGAAQSVTGTLGQLGGMVGGMTGGGMPMGGPGGGMSGSTGGMGGLGGLGGLLGL